MKILMLVLLWIVIFILAFVAPRFIEPTGSGFTRGTNRLPALMGLHCVAFLVALVTAALSYRSRAELGKWLLAVGFVPLAVDLLLLGLAVIAILLAMFVRI